MNRKQWIVVAGVLISAACLSRPVNAQQLFEGPNNPGAAYNDPTFGIPAWTTPGNATSSDGMYAQAAPGGLNTQYLHADNFDFTIPSPAVVDGIEVDIEKKCNLGTIKDARVRIVKGGVVGSTDESNPNFWPTTDTVVTYGGPSDLWGETWTPADINANNFGVVLSATDSTDTALVDDIQIKVFFSLCTQAPKGSCRTSAKSLFLVRNKTDTTKDKLIWKWIKGASTSQSDFADPTATAIYAMCVYENGVLTTTLAVPPSASLWKSISTKGFKYKDTAGSSFGIQKILLHGSTSSTSKVLVKGKGSLLPNPAVPLTLPVEVQVINSDTGVCFDATYTTFKKNSEGLFKGKNG